MKKVLQPRVGVAALVFFLALGVAIPDSPGPAPSASIAMASTRSSELLAKAERIYWEFEQRRDFGLRMRLGLPIDELPDLSEERALLDAKAGAFLLEKLRGLREHELSHEESLSLAVLREQGERLAASARDYWLTFPVTPHSSPLNVVAGIFTTCRFENSRDLERYTALLARYAALIRQMEDKLRAQARRGIRLPRPETVLVEESFRAWIAASPESPFFVTPERLENVAERDRAPFVRHVEGLIESRVNPALESLAAYVSGEYAAKAPKHVGLAQYEGGKAYYRRLVRLYTTLNVTPEEVHRLGLAEVERANRELDEVRVAVGFEGTLADFRRHLRTDPRFVPESPEAIGRRLLEAQKRIESKIPLFFGRTPSAPAGIRRLSPALEGALNEGYYQAPSARDRRGYYFYNGSKIEDRSLLNAAALVYHELVPGHHFQVALAQENDDLPSFRRTSHWTAYTEGWGEYASSLAGEMGMYEDPWDRAGRLVTDALVSARLVVDTGMNALGWSRSRAVAYMRENTLESDDQIAAETLRDACDVPGQALAFKMGALKIRELRDRASRELGTSFDVRRFHDAVLGSGPMPLAVLERHIDWFIDAEKARVTLTASR
jgi:uncharacterized protein (DUF885 family)